MGAILRRGAGALGCVLVASVAITMPASAAPDPRAGGGACSTADGVTVVVDFGSAGGGVQTRCASAPVASGFAALQQAGFAITNVRTQPGFLCQIDAQPASDCQQVPQGQYWSYWHAPRGGAWTYSTSGASRKPPPGTVEGWSLGAGQAPGVAPPPPAPAPTTSTTRVASPTPVVPPTTVARAPVPTAGAPASPDPAGVAPTTTTTLPAEAEGPVAGAGPTISPRRADGIDDDEDQDEDDEVAGSRSGRDDAGGGSPIGALVGLGAVGALATAGAVTARRRRQAEPAGA